MKRSKKEYIGYKRSRESGSGGPKRKIQKGSEHRVSKRALSSNYKTNRGKQYSLFIEEQARSDKKNTRRRGNQQQKDQERKGGANILAESYLWRS
ncbi:hypothetical protein TNCV_1937551 [Trichonephila clavipes]|nr:hypothetical protein TNCV_1937551 [Trichonephila clavipes]